MQVTINLDVDTIEKLERFRLREIARIESLVTKYDDVDSEDNSERTLFYTSYAEDYKKFPIDMLILRYLRR